MMWNWLGRMFGTPAAAAEMVKMTRDSLDALVYTDEEKSVDHAKAVTEARSMTVEWMKATSGQNLARRLIALSLTALWGVIYGAQVVLGVARPWLGEEAAVKSIESIAALSEASSSLNGAMMLILGFYFAAPHLDKIVTPAMEKFSGKKN